MDDNDAVSSPSQPKRASLFLSCFCFSGKPKDSAKINHRSRLFRRSTFLLKQSAAGTKTVPLDSTASDKIQHKKIISMFKKSKLIKKNPAGNTPLIKPHFTPAPVKPLLLETKPNLEKKVLVENGKFSDYKKSRIDQSDKYFKKVDSTLRSNELFRKRITSIRSASSQPGSPDTNSGRINMVPRSTSFPAKTPAGNLTGKTRAGPKKPQTRAGPKKPRANKFDAMMGMSIIMMTLVIILIWGRLCAIICTCTWLYFVPRLRKNGNGDVDKVNLNPGQTIQNGLVLEEPNFNSEEYEKKRVVLEGFLVRNNHNMNRSAV